MRKTRQKVYKQGYDVTGHPQLKHKITLISRIEIKNEILNEYQQTDEVYKEKYACIIPQTNKLINQTSTDTTFVNVTHKAIIRYDKNVTDDMFCEYQGKRYTINFVLDPYEKKQYMELYLSEVH